MSTGLDPILHIGKGGITENLVDQVDTALEARELIKLRVLPSCSDSVEDTADRIAWDVGAELVQTIGRNFVLFRRSEKKPQIQLP